MQKAREWLAKTETRLEEINTQAREQVKLLGSLLKEGKKDGRDREGAPSMGAREMVTRLAHQGWSVEEIARATKLSRGEVELILEIIPRK
jgi:DNA-binding NarL/FixJ family response regulator